MHNLEFLWKVTTVSSTITLGELFIILDWDKREVTAVKSTKWMGSYAQFIIPKGFNFTMKYNGLGTICNF